MEILENKAVLIRTRNPSKYTVIPKSRIVEDHGNGGCTVAVFFGLDEMRVLKNLGVKNVPSPITARYNWPGRYKPMAHQIETAAFLTLHRKAFCFNEPGTAKTISSLWAADYLMTRGYVRRVLILCPLSIMYSAWMGDIMNSIMHRKAVVAHHAQASRRIELVKGDYEFVITNYEGLNLLNKEINNDGRFDLVIVDECFVAGTLVSTPQGRRPIAQLEAGDEVLTSDGIMRIKRLVRNTATQLVEVKLGNGKIVRCTPEHPFFTDVGWVCAKNLAGRRLISGAELSRLRDGIPPQKSADALVSIEGDSDWGYLFQILRTEEVASNESRSQLLQPYFAGSTGENVGAEDARTSGEVVSSSESQRAQADCARGERYGHDADGTVDFRGLTCGVGMELPSSVGQEAARLSYELQARLCVAAPQGGVGSGRGQPQPAIASSAGSQEGSQAGGAWVESVSYIECPNGEPVYNLEVEGTPNYFVGDHWLVHNCNAYANPSTQRWKSLASIIHPHTYLWMMTGTPAAQSPLNAYGLAKLVNPNSVPKFYTAWRDKVMNKITQFKWAPKPNAKTIVHEVLQPAIRFTKEQCLDLPPVITTTREVALSAQQLKYYKLLKEQMLAQAAGETISAVNAGVMVSKLLQVSAGAVYTDEKGVVEFDASARLNVLLEAINETDRKVIVFAMFRSSIDTITAHLEKNGIKTAQIHGGVNATKRGQIINDFQHTQNVQVLVMQPQATAHGITLTAADTVVFYGPLMSVEMYLQCIARADRKGQNSDKVTVVHIQSSPIEKKLFKAMASKVDDHALLVKMFESEVKNL
jgi:superfamily II DNA or RNA helicase